MAGLLGIGLTGLNTAQAQLNTTSHNIANAGAAGYSRQTVLQSTVTPMYTGAGFIGQGARLDNVKREYSQYLQTQLQQTGNRLAEYTTYNNQISQVANLLADSSSGLTPSLQNFFKGVQEVAAHPNDVAARQSMISAANSMVERFNALDLRLSEMRQGVEDGIADSIDEINAFASQIAMINKQLLVAQKSGPAIPANDLLDQRDKLLNQLNEQIGARGVLDKNGLMTVFIGSGQPLVLGVDANQLQAIPSLNDPARYDVALLDGSTTVRLPERLLTGGNLGGLLRFRSEGLDTAQNQLGLVALGIAETFNKQHKLGVDLDGVLGQDFFKAPQPVLMPNIDTSVTIDDVSKLTSSDYLLTFDGSNYTVMRLPDKTTAYSGTMPAVVDGMTITPGGDSIPTEGLLIQPTRYAARNLGVTITDPRKVAAGNPVLSNVPSSNTGTGKVSAINVKDITGMDSSADGTPDFTTLNLSFTAGAPGSLTVGGGATIERYDPISKSWSAPAASVDYDTASTDVNGTQLRITDASGFVFEFTISGVPANGDSFNFSPNTTGVADNRNAVALGALQTAKTLSTTPSAATNAGPDANFQTAYSRMVADVGNKARSAQVSMEAQQVQYNLAKEARESLAGVNLDEEAANLVRYQQAYQASARVMTVAQRLFDTLLAVAQ